MLEVLSLDLYLDVQVGVTFSQNAGDYHLELTEYQVSLTLHFAQNARKLQMETLGCARCATYHTWGGGEKLTL